MASIIILRADLLRLGNSLLELLRKGPAVFSNSAVAAIDGRNPCDVLIQLARKADDVCQYGESEDRPEVVEAGVRLRDTLLALTREASIGDIDDFAERGCWQIAQRLGRDPAIEDEIRQLAEALKTVGSVLGLSAREAHGTVPKLGPDERGGASPPDGAPADLEANENLGRPAGGNTEDVLTPEESRVWSIYHSAVSAIASRPGYAGREVADLDAYNYAHDERDYCGSFEAFGRTLRRARERLGEQKNRPRSGRSGRSIVNHEDQEPRERDDG